MVDKHNQGPAQQLKKRICKEVHVKHGGTGVDDKAKEGQDN
jgi:hypothetical protein